MVGFFPFLLSFYVDTRSPWYVFFAMHRRLYSRPEFDPLMCSIGMIEATAIDCWMQKVNLDNMLNEPLGC